MLHRPSTEQFRARRRRIRRTVGSLLTAEQMNLAMQRETLRVDRKAGSSLVLVLFRFNGDASAPATLRLIKIVLHRIRITDDIGWFDAQHIGLLLPDTSPAGAWRLAQHICDRISRRAPRPQVVMYSYCGKSADGKPRRSVLRHSDVPAIHRAKAV